MRYSGRVSAETSYSGTVAPPGAALPAGVQEGPPGPAQTVLFGREAEQAELVQLMMGRGLRAGLLYGEQGVGKTMLLRAGLLPALHAQDVIALYCEDIYHPVEAFAQALMATSGIAQEEGESPLLYLDRVVVRSMSGKMFVFVLDHVDLALASGNEQLISDLGDLFARVVTRSSGRARFLFCCPSDRMHLFGALEQRTGSLFPPSSRVELARLDAARAAAVLAHILSSMHPAAEPALAGALVEGLAHDGPVLPAELQVMALAAAELGIASVAALARFGSPNMRREQLELAWLEALAAATGNRRAALRLLGELAVADGRQPSWMAARVGIDPGFAMHALSVLEARGLVHALPAPQGVEPGFALNHPSVRPRVRQVALPALDAARRWRDALGARASQGRPLSPRELWALRAEGIVPATNEERSVIERTRRIYTIAGAAALAVPVVLLVIIYVAISGRYYLDVAPAPGGERVVVRAGRPALDAFHWLPASPSFGSVVAEPGFSRAMVQDQAWARAAAGDIAGDLDGNGYATASLATLNPALRMLVDYASSGSEEALVALRKGIQGPDDRMPLLESLALVARGTGEEVQLVEQSLADASPAVQSSALEVAAQAARRQPGLYRETLSRALASEDEELRRLAFAAVRSLGKATAGTMFQEALGQSPGGEARRELLAEVTAVDTSAAPSAATAASILVNSEVSPRMRQDARSELRRAFAVEPRAAAAAAARLASDAAAPVEEQVLALELLRDLAPAEAYADVAKDIRDTLTSSDEKVRAAALSLYARIAPKDAAGELAVLLEKTDLSEPLRVAMALGWGEVAKSGEGAAVVALQKLLEDESPRVRAAAAEAYGNTGRGAQDALIDLVKTSRFDVALGAAFGLANSAEVGASTSTALGGIAYMWRRKGPPRRAAAGVFVRMARSKARNVYGYLVTAVRSSDDDELRAIGAAGLCNASVGGHEPSKTMLVRASLDSATEVRRAVMQCVADNPFDREAVSTVAVRLSHDGDDGIRTDAARALLQSVEGDTVAEPVARAVLRLVADRERGVRAIAARALARMGSGAPEDTAKALQRAYERADEDEKLLLLETSRAVGTGELVPQAALDESPAVRIAALDTAIATGTNVASTVSAALTDSDAVVRRAALVRLGDEKNGALDQQAMGKSLRLALRDADPAIARLALTTLVRLEDTGAIAARLREMLAARSERARARAAAACIGLAERDADAALALLVPLLDDPSHDVRVAMLPALAAAYAATRSPEELAALLRGAERHAMRRVAATAAFLVLARADGDAATAALTALAEQGPPLVRVHARLGLGLLESKADGIAFLDLLVP